MMSHCTASLKLTPWHEGTFASSVIYSPPQLPPFPPLVSNLLSPPSLSLLPQNDIHYFIVKQESFFSCSPGTKWKEEGRIWGHRRPNHSSARFRGGNWSSSLCDPGPLLKMAVCCTVEAGMRQNLWGNTAACMRRTLLGQDRGKGLSVGVSARIFTSSNHIRLESCLSSLTDMSGWLAAIVHSSECRDCRQRCVRHYLCCGNYWGSLRSQN